MVLERSFTMIETIYVQELAFSDKERAFEVAKLLLEEDYTVTMSKKEELIIINFSVTLPSIYRSK
jgi:hypothetical protein